MTTAGIAPSKRAHLLVRLFLIAGLFGASAETAAASRKSSPAKATATSAATTGKPRKLTPAELAAFLTLLPSAPGRVAVAEQSFRSEGEGHAHVFVPVLEP